SRPRPGRWYRRGRCTRWRWSCRSRPFVPQDAGRHDHRLNSIWVPPFESEAGHNFDLAIFNGTESESAEGALWGCAVLLRGCAHRPLLTASISRRKSATIGISVYVSNSLSGLRCAKDSKIVARSSISFNSASLIVRLGVEV